MMVSIRLSTIIALVMLACPACQTTEKSDGIASPQNTEHEASERQQERSEPAQQAGTPGTSEASGEAEQKPAGEANQADRSTEAPSEEAGIPVDPVEPVDGKLGDGVSAALIPIEEDPTRRRRRMDIDQLNQTIIRVTGGIGWTQANKNQFDVLASTLGKPDYIDLTKEDFEPSALFQKFLDDAARAVCYELVKKELSVPSNKRVFMVYSSPYNTWDDDPAAIDKNLTHLILRYHGRDLKEKPAELQQWRWLYRSAEHVSKKPVTAWRTVCIGLMNHPYFYTY